MNKKLIALTLAAGGVLLTGAAARLMADAALPVVARATTRLNPVTVAVVPVVAAPVIVVPVATPPVTVVLPVAAAPAESRPGRPPIIVTRSPGRPAPIVPIPR